MERPERSLQTGGFQGVQQGLAGRAAQSLVHGFTVGEQERGLERVQRGHKGRDVRGGGAAHGHVALDAGFRILTPALGATPGPLAFGELYTALQTSVVQGQDNPAGNTVDGKFYESIISEAEA